MNNTNCPDCSYVCDIRAKMCEKCFAEWESAVDANLKARHSQLITDEEIKRLQAIELAANRVYRNRNEAFDDPVKLHQIILGIGRVMSPPTPAQGDGKEGM